MDIETITALISEALTAQAREGDYLAIRADDLSSIDYEGNIDARKMAAYMLQRLPTVIPAELSQAAQPGTVSFEPDGALRITITPHALKRLA